MGGPVSVSFQPIGEPTVIVNSSADHEVPREIDVGTGRNSGVSGRNSGSSGGADGAGGERRESLVEVIVVDSSDEVSEEG
jgi:hypothetical protein